MRSGGGGGGGGWGGGGGGGEAERQWDWQTKNEAWSMLVITDTEACGTNVCSHIERSAKLMNV